MALDAALPDAASPFRSSDVARRPRFATPPWTLVTGALLFLLVALTLCLGPWLAPHDPTAQALIRRLKPPSEAHWLGTDHLGRDVFSRLLVGGHFAIVIAAVTLTLSVVIGTLIGVISARKGGLFDEIAMRSVDLLISFPEVVVAIFLIALLGPGYGTLILALTLVSWTPFARLARGLAMEINAKPYIRAAEILGCSRRFIILRHIIPNAIGPISALAFLRFGHKMITVGGLSYIGLGIQPPHADWAAMMAEAQPYIERAPLLVLCPGLAIFITALSVTWIGQGLSQRGGTP
ncbi:ABC transporter permease [Bosea sp. PAMC 26642]|uniref:ABC transporter permease n=1 Tax=Bosea sp. (strain PAMC 26642) TaxID=1792307 RepID=UPI0007705D89|nr:ABC transporter permease [Bosea sp. PAMC 26642]AMJ61710.1 ABC transporter permease [Bosea sp. PAMC 26642]